MSTLWLVRHGKTEPKRYYPGSQDVQRPLSLKGREGVAAVGQYLAEMGCEPDLILCSSSKRTRQTYEELGFTDAPVWFLDELYLASQQELEDIIIAQADGADQLMVIGHHPGIGELADALSLGDDGADAQDMRDKFPKGAAAQFDVDGEWDELMDEARLEDFVKPSDL